MAFTHKQLKAFVAVASQRSFAAASAELHISQPALSIAIRNLEEVLGGRLVQRTTRNVSLTPEGEAFYPRARRLLEDWAAAYEDMHNRFNLQRGRLAVACMPSFAATEFPSLMARYHAQHPEIDISLEDMVMEDVIESVRSGRFELGIAFAQDLAEEVEFQPLLVDQAVVALPASHKLAQSSAITWRQLAAEPFISLNQRSGFRTGIDEMQLSLGAVPTRIYEANQLTTVGRMAAEGLGLCIVPGFCQQQMRQMGLVCKPLQEPLMQHTVGLFWRKRHALSVPARAMVDLLVQVYAGKDTLPWRPGHSR